MSENDELVEFTVRIPKKQYEFLKIFSALIGENLEDLIKPQIKGLIRSIIDDPTVFYKKEEIMDKLEIEG